MEKINHPSHYQNKGIETIDYIEATMTFDQSIGFCMGNVIKYVSRWQTKDGIDDLKKAKWYLDRAIVKLEKLKD